MQNKQPDSTESNIASLPP